MTYRYLRCLEEGVLIVYEWPSHKSSVSKLVDVAVFEAFKEMLRNLIEEMSYFDEEQNDND